MSNELYISNTVCPIQSSYALKKNVEIQLCQIIYEQSSTYNKVFEHSTSSSHLCYFCYDKNFSILEDQNIQTHKIAIHKIIISSKHQNQNVILKTNHNIVKTWNTCYIHYKKIMK